MGVNSYLCAASKAVIEAFARCLHYKGCAYIFLFLFIGVFSASDAIAFDDDLFQDNKLGLTLEVPEGWTLYPYTGFPELPFIIVNKKQQDALITLAVGELGSKQSLESFVAMNKPGFQSINIQILNSQSKSWQEHSSLIVRARTLDNSKSLQQNYIQNGRRVFIFTLACPARSMSKFNSDFLRMLELMKISKNAANQSSPPVQSTSSGPNIMPNPPATTQPTDKAEDGQKENVDKKVRDTEDKKDQEPAQGEITPEIQEDLPELPSD